MSTIARHWVATVPGVTDEVSDDAYLWLDADATGQQGQLWVVADGHGPAEGCALASAVVVHTIADEYPEIIAELGAPFAAMTRCMELASERVRTMAMSQPALQGMTVSCAAIAEFDGLVWAVSVGTARAYVLRGETLERVSTDQVSASHVATDDTSASRIRRDDVVIGALGSERPSIVPCAGGPIEPEGAAFLLATEGTWRALTAELMIGALERMQPKTAVDAMLEVGLMKFADCAMTACIIRYSQLDIRRVTGRAQFLAWAAGDAVMSAEANKTLMLDPAALDDHGTPSERLHPPQIPNIAATRRSPAVTKQTEPQAVKQAEPEVEPSIERTALFSLQDIHSALAREEATGGPQTVPAAHEESSPTDRHAPITSVGAAVHADVERTAAFSPQLVKDAIAKAKVADLASEGESTSTSADGAATVASSAAVSSSTMAFSPQDLAALRSAEAGQAVTQITEAAPGRVPTDAHTTLEEEPIENTVWMSRQDVANGGPGEKASPGQQAGAAPTLDAPSVHGDALRSDTMFAGTGKHAGAPGGPPHAGAPGGPPQTAPPGGPPHTAPPGGPSAASHGATDDALRSETALAGTGNAGPTADHPSSHGGGGSAQRTTADAPRVGGDATLMEPSRPHFRSDQPQPSDTKTTPRKKPQIPDPFAERWDGRDTSGDSGIVPYREGGGIKRVILFLVVVAVAAGLGFLAARHILTLL